MPGDRRTAIDPDHHHHGDGRHAVGASDEGFTVTLGAITTTLPATQVTLKSDDSSATATIAESDPITVNISGPSTVDEGDATTAYTVSLSPAGVKPTADLTVSYATSNGTATAGSDYTAKTGTLTFTQEAPGDQTFTVDTTEDTVDEGTGETFTVTISGESGGGGSTSLGTSTVTTTITDDDDAPTGITLSASPNTLGEDDAATSVTITATLNGSALPSDTVVTIGTLSGSATKDTDYTAGALASITIPANSASGTGTLTITPTDDAVVEGDETIIISGTTTTQVGLTVTSATITLTDDNKTTTTPTDDKDKAELSISGPSASVSEGGNATFTVTLSKAVAAEVQVAWNAPLGTDAAEGADLSATSGTVTFPANSAAGATQSITIAVTDDMLSEGAESFTVTLGTITTTLPATQVTLKTDDSTATATIAKSDPITINISGPSTVDEGNTTTAYTVSLSPTGVKPTADLTVSYGTSNGTATAGTDYTAKSGTLTFTSTAAGVQTFTVSTTEDTVDEGTGETFTVTISSPSGGGGPAPSLGTATVTTTITDDDDAPTGITLSANPSTLGEDDAATSVTVTANLNGSSLPSDTVVTIGTLTGRATKDTDYTATSLASITIPANSTSGTGSITITPTDDAVVEGDETIIISGTTTVSLDVSDATITLNDHNGTTTGDPNDKDSAEISISGPGSNVTEGSNATFTVTLSKAVDAEVQVAWSAPLGTDAAEGSDLGTTSGTVTFPANSAAGATQSITITATDDMLSEGDESFTVTLGAITSDLSSQVSLRNGASSDTATIAESDPITVTISGPTSVDEGDTTTAYTVSLSPSGVKPTADLTVSYATSNGTATAGSDYTAKSGTLTFTNTAAGSQTFTVDTTEDTFDEADETFVVTISSPSGGGGATPTIGTASVTTTIGDDDAAISGITLSVSPTSVGEDDAKTEFTVTASLGGATTRSSDTVVTLTLGGSAGSSDYTVNTSLGSITIPANATSGTGKLELTPTDDAVVEGDETIIISGTTTEAVGLTVASATITLSDHNGDTDDEDDKDTAEISISGPGSNVTEGSNATFTVTLSKAVDAQVQVGWSAPLGTDAAEAADLGTTSGTVTFAANSAAGATQTITITTTNDNLSETAETFTVTLGTITSDLSSQISLKSGASNATATISASDPITVTISGPSTVDEGDATTAYTVSLSPAGVKPTADLTVSYATSNGTATAGSDYTAKSGTLTFTNAAAGAQTFTVDTTEDTVDEGTGETFTVSISSPLGGGGATPTLGTASVTTTITDDDAAPTGITLSVSPGTLGEDDSATEITVTATLQGGSTRPTSTVVTIGALAGTATKDTDYTATTLGNITIPANSSSGSQTFTVTPTDDAVVEGDETIIISGTTTVNLSVTSATVTLTDDDKTTTPPGDKDTATLSISGPSANVAEDSDATFTVTLSKAVDAQVQVAWSAPLGTDAAGSSDLGSTSGTVTFAANSAAGTTRTITIAATNDALSETSESFTVTLGTITSDLSSQISLKNGASSATATIAESDPITISISGPSTVDEGDATTAYTVSLSPSGVTPTSDLTVSYNTANGTATAGSDYTAASGTLTFTSAAAGSQTFTLQTTEDTFDETDETFTVTISSPLGGGGATPTIGTASVTTTIADDDAALTGIALSVNPATLGEDDSATTVTVTATLQGGSTRPTNTVVTIGTLSGTATKDTDYTATALASITILANTTSGTGTITVTPTDDAVVEGDETIIISGTTTVSLTVSDTTVTLTDDDKSTTPGDDKDSAELSISGPSANVAEGSDATFTVTLSKAVSKQVTVGWSAPLGTDAAEGADLGSTSGTVTFAANSAAGATQSITITATDDMLSETAEGFTVTLGTITSTLSSQISLKNGASSDTATISASDPITVNISGPSTVDEGDTTTAYTVSLSPSGVTPTADLTVSYGTSNGTATAGSDYTAKSGTLTFTSTDAGSQTFTVQTTGDSVDEGTGETFTVTISSPSGGGGAASSLGTSSVSTTITDDDDAPTGITLSASPNTLGEDDSATPVTVTATLNGGTTRTSATVVTIGTLKGSATEDTDYTATSLTSITIPANSTSGTGTLTITPTDDAVVEGDETIIISGTTTVNLDVSSATVTLTDDDKSTTTPSDKDSAEISISGPTSNVSEGSNATFTVTLSKAVDADVTVAWSAPLGTDAASGTDLSATSGTVTFAANSAANATQSITITATDDMLSEGDEAFTVTLGTITSTLSSQISLKNGASSDTATIAASDAITISISGPSNVDEGDTTTAYTVSLSPSGVKPTADLTVSYGTSNGTATAGSDYTAKSGTLTFTNAAAGSQTFTVQTTGDTFHESDETFTVTISSPSGGGGPAPSLATTKSVTTTIDDDDNALTGIALSASPNTIGEDDAATSITVTATLQGGSTWPSDTVVTIGTLSGSATKDTDYSATSLTSITIPANTASATGTLTITPTDDSVVEGDETITIPGTTTVTGLSVTSATVTLTDDDKSTTTPGDKDSAELSISGPTSNVAEGGNASFTVTLSKAVDAQVQVAWSAPLGTDAAVAADLGSTSGTVTFAANSAAGATQSIAITTTNDNLSETSESFTVTLGTITSDLSSQISLKNGAKTATATIAASDPITISISGPSSVDEGDATSNYTVSLSPAGVTPTSDLTVSYATSNGTAVAGSDYTAKTGTLTFTNTAAGDQTFTVQTTGDDIDEGTGETFTVTISSATGGGGTTSLGTSTVTTTITDDDDAPSGITLSVSPSSVGEDDAATSVTVTATLQGGSTRPTSTVVTIGTLKGSATKDTDYTATSLASITIPANSTSGTGSITITPTDDAVVEGDETIIISGTTMVSLSVTSATVTLKDHNGTTTGDPNDKDTAELSISGPTASVSEGSDATFTVTLSKAVSKEVQVAWTATGNTDDYSPDSGTVTFAANSSAGAKQNITIMVTDDMLSETAETFTVTLGTITSDLSSQVSLKSGAKAATATIGASDPITVAISGTSTSVEEGDAVTYTVSISGGIPSADLTVNYATSDGTATAGSDYTAASGTLTFTQASHGDQTVDVQTTDDIRAEAGENFTITISSPQGGGGTTSLGTSSVTTTIGSNDATSDPPDNRQEVTTPIDIQLSVTPSSVNENAGATNFTVTATHDAGSTRTEDIVISLTLGGTADDSDYTAPASASVTIPANQSSGSNTLTLTLIDDDVSEGDETIIVGGSFETLVIGSALITISDDDSAYLSIAGPSVEVAEGSNATFTVTLSKSVSAAVTVAWSATAGTASTSDYGTASGSVTFPANSGAGATQTITIPVTNDSLSEGSETFSVELGADTGDQADTVWVKTTAASATATIAESDPITINITGPSSVDEGDSTTSYTVSLSPSGVTPTEDLTISYATSNGTATAGSDYIAKSSTLTFTSTAAGSQTFTVSTTEDSIDEGTGETFTVTISSPVGGGGALPTLGTATVSTTITDDDAPSDIALSVDTSSIAENDSATTFTVTATLNGGITRTSATVVTIGTLAGSATEDTDYEVTTSLASITIPANSSNGTGTITITPTNDDVVEGDETISIPGTTTVSGLSVSDAIITLTDHNTSQQKDSAKLSISGPTSNVSEGASASFTVTLSKAVAKEVTVNWSAPQASDAAAATDLEATSGTVTFAANSAAGSTQTITIAATDDALSETAESFSVTLGAVGGDLSSQVSVDSSAGSATATIAASDPITVSISGPSSVGEGDTTTVYTVSLSGGALTADLTVDYATSDGTATAGSDYTSKSGTLTFTSTAAGAQTFTVETTEDTVDESDETFTVTISSSSGGGGTTSLGTATVTTTINDDDDAPSPPSPPSTTSPPSPPNTPAVLSITGPGGSVAEGLNATFTVNLSRSVAVDVTVAWSATAGTAESSDYSPDSGTVTFPAGSSTRTITIAITNDLLSETSESFTVTLGSITSGLSSQASVDTSAGSATATIAASDPITVTLSGPSTVNEGDIATYTVSLSPSGVIPTEGLTVSYATADGTATAGSDYTAASGTLTFTATSAGAQTFTVQTTDDSTNEGTGEAFSVTISSPSGSGGPAPSLATSSVTTTITDDDTSENPNPTPPQEPTSGPTPEPTPRPAPEPSTAPTQGAISGSTLEPSPTSAQVPTLEAAATPTPTPTQVPTLEPTATPTPTQVLTPEPTPTPTPESETTPGLISTPGPPNTSETSVIALSWISTLPWWLLLLIAALVAVVIKVTRKRAMYALRQSPALLSRLWSLLIGVVYGRGG